MINLYCNNCEKEFGVLDEYVDSGKPIARLAYEVSCPYCINRMKAGEKIHLSEDSGLSFVNTGKMKVGGDVVGRSKTTTVYKSS